MKRILITFTILLGITSCFAQSIDTAALKLMQISWDKLAGMEYVSYQMTNIDTMIRENHFEINRVKIDGTVKKNDYLHIHADNNFEWLIRGDTLYKKGGPGASTVTFATDWNRHKLEALSIYNLLGHNRPVSNIDVISLQFIEAKPSADFHIIHEISKIDYGSDEIKSILRYNRYFINKKTLLPIRRVQYGKSLDNGKESVDIYDFSVEIMPNMLPVNIGNFFNSPPMPEQDQFDGLSPGINAPNFTAKDTKNGKEVSLDSFKGKVVVLDFWYLSCLPCRMLMPKLQQLQQKFGKDKVVLLGVNIRDQAAKDILKFLKDKQILYPQLYQPEQFLVLDYKLKAFPTTLVLDQKGKIKLIETGVGENTIVKLEQAIEQEL